MTFTRGYLHAGKLDIRRHELYSLRVMQDVLAGVMSWSFNTLAITRRRSDPAGDCLG